MGIIDIALLAIVALVTWCVAGEGAWGAVFTFLSVLFAGLLTMNYFEPLAGFFESAVLPSGKWRNLADFLAMTGLFAALVFGFREVTTRLAPGEYDIHPLLYEGARWGGGLASGYLTMAILLTALHTAPLPREFIGFKPERKNFLTISAPDRQWLGFTQRVSEEVFRQGSVGRIFDGPQFRVGDQTNDVWPSFPIRYASRREAYAAGGGPAGPTRAAPVQRSPKRGRKPGPMF